MNFRATPGIGVDEREGEEDDMGEVISRDGTSISFDRQGDGPVVVVVDGALSHRRLGPTAPLADTLAPDFTVYRYDRRGRGESGDTLPYTVAREVEDLASVIAEAGGSACVAGISSGAALALEAAAGGLPITKLALYEPPFSVDPEDPAESKAYLDRLEQLIAADRRGDAVDWFLSAAGVPAEALAEMRAQPEWPLFEAVAPTLAYDHAILGDGAVPYDRAAGITATTLVANGGASPDFFQHAAAATASAIPKATHRVLEGQGWGQADPDALAAMIKEFFLDAAD
jgi:pimeloyl-ACP methyl ester carboxylesterase